MVKHDERPASKLKKHIFEVITKDEEGDVLSKIYDIFSVILIVLSLLIIILDTFPIPTEIHNVFVVVEYVIAIFFVVEYILRVWTAEYEFPECAPDKAKMKYIYSHLWL